KKYPGEWLEVRSYGFHNADLARLLNGYRDQSAHDSERRDDHDKEQKEKHYRAFKPHGLEVLMVHVDPGLRVLWWLEKLLDGLFYALGAVWVIGPYCDAMQAIIQAV